MESQSYTSADMEIDEMIDGVIMEDMDHIIPHGYVVDTFSTDDLETMFDFKAPSDQDVSSHTPACIDTLESVLLDMPLPTEVC